MSTAIRKRPLFEEPSEECEREDPWSGPKGFMFGGWSLPSGTTWEMAQQYYDAATLLIEGIERMQIEDYRIGVAVLYLYRHWLELAVKGICRNGFGHNLQTLSKELARHLEKNNVNIPEWIVDRLLEMDKIDPKSTAFRYAEDSIAGEVYVSLPHLRYVMTMLHAALSSLYSKGQFPPESHFVSLENNLMNH